MMPTLPRTTLAGLSALAVAGLLAAALASQVDGTFPHDRHAGLFPLCTGCHAGVPTGDPAAFYPDSADCAPCHDGVRQEPVSVSPPLPSPGNLTFSHPDHDRAVRGAGDGAAECGDCHREEGAEEPMRVQGATAERCMTCHAHQADAHLAPERSCRSCHRPLAEAPGLAPGRIAAFPAPDSHGTEGFLSNHDPAGDAQRCAVCHARESCTRCHMNAEAVAPIRDLPRDGRVAGLVRDEPPRYPRPESHEGPGWRWGHGPAADESPAGCANCHAAPGCLTCHREGTLPELASLPRPGPEDPRGVHLAEGVVHPPGYALDHTAAAGAAPGAGDGCAGCHAESFCASCHDAADRPAFHLPGFLESHGPEAYSAATDCASCHSVEVFCRSCHAELGMADQRRAGVTFHTSQPFWLLGHGIAARQGLEGCVSCHSQADCASCHSAFLGWGVNPHGPSFDGAALRDANPFSCSPCHLGGVPR